MHQLIEEALRFAAVRHDGQFRKGTNIPYVTHPVAVSMLLVEDRQPIPVVAAGLLHDLLEDTLTTAEEIEQEFGREVARLVQAVSEPGKHHSWEERKRMTIQKVHTLQYDEVALLAADKLHNLRSIRLDIEREGKQVWGRFKRPLRDQSWYYHELLHALQPFSQTTSLIDEFEIELNLLFYGVEEDRDEKLNKLFDVIGHGFHEDDWLQESSTLCQTAYELNESMREGYRHGSEAERLELETLKDQLQDSGLRQDLSIPVLQAINELSYRAALRSEDVITLLK
ncbi:MULTISPECIES: HD domain-containing protein [unclassified Exiguobacterium]|uniref:HD domain-containing protein n=1 Tax=unclassified Exiguobacterium TaxID=2644629 RepID=UPI00103F9650|nr:MULTISPECIES: HD domain-containing protein [unclassified Exiguobacterium]TCI39784.1 bifunctional (p)ppGpp synthetase/guanosine-3',5'-bis(diphosphate) 3'-pyrophosphohydrolase [Exiguobacterium sp. SH4S7]TCI47523.1 bifunctional (p)ppGpp synthetase/guanosine-3',5'-bis(diphosphate) 3'-pyrophosphohydrolase [Exiguobacterium sp. SH5S32]TCI54406.1 bifunctional (p)ppGpp synthetase/guanosine-3',5'-bis(diphosphate) 3'-pyrophosphohydrolase [Exiguobacterium sp. SH1S4]TCI65088.1 bifunctional (p)ppGpp synth